MQETTDAAVVVPVKGNSMIGAKGLALPTPEWARMIVRALTWITGIYAFVIGQIDLKDFGITEHTAFLILKYMAVFTSLVSIAARFTGVQPPELTAEEKQ